MTKCEGMIRRWSLRIDSDFGFGVSSVSFAVILICQILQVLLDLSAVFFGVFFAARLGDGVAVALGEGLVGAVVALLVVGGRAGKAAALDAVALAGAFVGIVGAVALTFALALFSLAFALALAGLLTFALAGFLAFAGLALGAGHFSIEAGLGERERRGGLRESGLGVTG